MIDVEFVSELLLLTMHGVTNKKDLLDIFYAKYDEELPDEVRYETDFNTALNLFWSIVQDSPNSSYKTRSNFYSIFGACLTYYRETGRRSFRNPQTVSNQLSEFFDKVRANEFLDDNPEIERYSEAVTRAASDKNRRVERERILIKIIRDSEVSA
jgi:hypothetical protein